MIFTSTSQVDYLYIPRFCRTRIWHHWSILLQTSHPLGSYTDLWAEIPVITKIFDINDPKGTLSIWGELWTLENISYYIINYMDFNPLRSTPAANKTMCFTPKIKKIEHLFRFRAHMHMLSIELSVPEK